MISLWKYKKKLLKRAIFLYLYKYEKSEKRLEKFKIENLIGKIFEIYEHRHLYNC